MTDEFSQADLESFLDEALTPEEMTEIEARLRDDAQLSKRLRIIHSRRDAGVHTLGEIWRRQRISCPDREDLGNYLLGVLEEDHQDYIRFHLQQIGCRLCNANVADMESLRKEAADSAKNRQQRFFQTSAGFFAPEESPDK